MDTLSLYILLVVGFIGIVIILLAKLAKDHE